MLCIVHDVVKNLEATSMPHMRRFQRQLLGCLISSGVLQEFHLRPQQTTPDSCFHCRQDCKDIESVIRGTRYTTSKHGHKHGLTCSCQFCSEKWVPSKNNLSPVYRRGSGRIFFETNMETIRSLG